MKTTLHTDWTVCDVGNGFVSDRDDDNGLLGLDGQLIIQPKHQYNCLAYMISFPSHWFRDCIP